MDGGFAPVYRALDEPTAGIVRMALEDAGIPAITRATYGSLVYDGVIAMAEGYWGDVLVEEKNVEEAMSVLSEYAECNLDIDGRTGLEN